MIVSGNAIGSVVASNGIFTNNSTDMVTDYLQFVVAALRTSASAGTRSLSVSINLSDSTTPLTLDTGAQVGTATSYGVGLLPVTNFFSSGVVQANILTSISVANNGIPANIVETAYFSTHPVIQRILVTATLIAGDTYDYAFGIEEKPARELGY